MKTQNSMKLQTILSVSALAWAVSACEAPSQRLPVEAAPDLAIADVGHRFSLSPGRMKILLRDSSLVAAHPSIQQARIQIVGVHFRSVDEAGWYRVAMDPVEIDLLSLGSSIGDVLARSNAKAGQYDQIRLITAQEGTVILDDGSDQAIEMPLVVPSGPQTGIKVHFESPLEIRDCHLSVATLDLNVQDSLVLTQNKVLFKPVIHLRGSDPLVLGESCLPPADDSSTGDGSGSTGDGSGSTGDGSGSTGDGSGSTGLDPGWIGV